jgi:hypothetical protein
MIRTMFGRGASLAVKVLLETRGGDVTQDPKHVAPIVAPVTRRKSLLFMLDLVLLIWIVDRSRYDI